MSRRRDLLCITCTTDISEMPYNEIWYTNGSTTAATQPYEPTHFNTNIVSNTYDAEKECWVIKFNGDVTYIGQYALGDNNFTSITMPNSVVTIETLGIAYCSSLTSVTIPDSVTTIGFGAFFNCISLTSVYCLATTPPALDGTYVFDNNGSGRKIYVPYQSLDAYKTATNWSEYAADIVGYDFENDVVVG